MIQVFQKLSHKKKEEAPEPPKREEVVLLEEIRDLLRSDAPHPKEGPEKPHKKK